MTDYFEWFQLPRRLDLDPGELRRRYLALSRAHHPDFHGLADDQAQEQALANTTLNNQAYRTLNDLGGRMRYLLERYGHWQEGEGGNLPGDFLMQMMEWNEAWEDAADAPQERHRLQQELKTLQDDLLVEFAPLLAAFEAESASPQDWQALRNLYARWVYLDRLQQRT